MKLLVGTCALLCLFVVVAAGDDVAKRPVGLMETLRGSLAAAESAREDLTLEPAACSVESLACGLQIEDINDCESVDTISECCDTVKEFLDCVRGHCTTEYEELENAYNDECTSGSGCFPSRSQVRLEDGSVKTMEELHVGDRVQTGKETFSEVFSWGHKDPETSSRFLRIHAGERIIQVTPSHYLVANNKLIAAGSVQPGDRLTLGEGGDAVVTSVDPVSLKGLYNPHTLDGRIVVDGVVASIYTRALPPTLAHALLALPKALYRLGLGDILGSYLHKASPFIARLLPRGSLSYN